MSVEPVKRVKYSQDQYLGPREFIDEQAYHVAMRRRHNVTGHGWGVANGLAVTFEAGELTVHPGYAVDKFGRELVLTAPLTEKIPVRQTQRSYDVWLCYHRREVDRVPPEFDPTCTQWSRWLEQPVLKITNAELGKQPDPDNPCDVNDCDKEYQPTAPAPEEKVPWPVFLARLTTLPNKRAVVDKGRRRYVSVVATTVRHPEHDTCLRLSAGQGCAISVSGEEAFTVRQEGVSVPGKLSVTRDLVVGEAISFTEQPVVDMAPARPWTVYRTGSADGHELRVELPAKDDKGNASFVIGSWSEQEFQPCLSVSADRVVTVEGTLLVKGRLDGYTGGGAVDEGLGEAIAAQVAANPALLAGLATSLRLRYPDAAEDLRRRLSERG